MKNVINKIFITFVFLFYSLFIASQASQDIERIKQLLEDKKLEELKTSYLDRSLEEHNVPMRLGVFYACLHTHDFDAATQLEQLIKRSDISIQLTNLFFDYYFWAFPDTYGILLDEHEAELYLDMQKQRCGNAGSMMVANLSNMANLFGRYGALDVAARFYEHMDEYQLEISPVQYARQRERLALIYQRWNHHQLAGRIFQECANIYKERFGTSHDGYLRCLHNVAFSNHYLNKNPLEMNLKLKDNLDSFGNTECIEYAILLDNISSCYVVNGDYDRALENLLKAKEIYEHFESYGCDYALNLNNIGECYGFKGDREKQQDYLLKAVSLAPDNNDILCNVANMFKEKGDFQEAAHYYSMISPLSQNTTSAHDIALFYASIGENEKFLEYESNYVAFIKNISQHNFGEMTNEEKELYVGVLQDLYTGPMFDIASKMKDSRYARLCYDYLLSSKSLMLSFITSIKDIVGQSDNELLKSLYLNMKMAHVKSYEDPSYKSYADSLEYLFQKELKKEGDFTNFINTQTADVVTCLKKNDLAIEFSQVRSQQGEYICAAILGNDNTPVVKVLCGVDELKEGDVYTLIWNPLSAYMQVAKNIYFSPDGVLHTLGIEYAKDRDGKLVCEKWNIFRLSSTRELTRKRGKGNQTNTAVLYGGLNYGFNTEDGVTVVQSGLRGSLQSTPELPGSKKEIVEIERLLKSKNYHVTVKTGVEGTEESLKGLSGMPISLLHLSTHGFFAKDREGRKVSLSQTGLLLSGADNYLSGIMEAKDDNDGVLTAEEISRLDFQQLDLVVLSACETGLGEITSDGVFGLQRGFKKAGARSLLMSLWEVDDHATELLMSDFYRFLTNGQTKVQALQRAIQQLRAYEQGKYADPKYWAAFILLDAVD
ncbi:MAG: CHAT domain-containing protein [Prevotella sp.]|nr:CHAT domain-containing protein [Prevotella sp.]